MRRRNRRSTKYNDYQYSGSNSDAILLEELEFHNKTQKVFEPDVFKMMRKEIKDKEQFYWTNKIFGDNCIGFRVFKKKLSDESKKQSVYIDLIDYKITRHNWGGQDDNENSYKINPKVYSKIKTCVNNKLFFLFDIPDFHPSLIDSTVVDIDGYMEASKKFYKDKHYLNYDMEESCYSYDDIRRYKRVVDDGCYQYPFTNDDKDLFRNIPKNYVTNIPNKFNYFNDWQQFIDFCLEKNCFSLKNCSYERLLHILKSLFDMSFDKGLYKFPGSDDENRYYSSIELKHIVGVHEIRHKEKNYRLAIVTKPHPDEGREYTLRVVCEDNPQYFFIDKGTFYFSESQTTLEDNTSRTLYFDASIDFNDKQKGVYTLDFNLMKKIRRDIFEITPKTQLQISPMIYKYYKEKYGRGGSYSEDDDDVMDIQMRKINDQYRKLIGQGKTVKIGDIKISTNSVELVSQRFKMEFKSSFIDVEKIFNKVRNALNVVDAEYNYNTIYENLLKITKLYDIDSSFEGASFVLNDMPISVYRQKNRMKINGIFCRMGDVYHILTKAICYNDIASFDKYVKDVSHIGIDWKKLINNGIEFKLKDPISHLIAGLEGYEKNENDVPLVEIRFSLRWSALKRSMVYLLINEKEYLIKYKGKFKKYVEMAPSQAVTIEWLKRALEECVEGIDFLILEVVENAMIEVRLVKERGRRLVTETLEDLKTSKTSVDINGKEQNGYIVIGKRTGNKYFINGRNLTTYQFIKGSWNQRCVHSASDKTRIFEDKLANRLVNIYNEPGYIHTIGKGQA